MTIEFVNLIGYPAVKYFDTGYFYCPYIPLTETPVVTVANWTTLDAEIIEPQDFVDQPVWQEEGF